MPPQIIVLNGAASAGKSSLALALQRRLHPDFLHMPIDAFAGMLPESARARCIRELAEHRGLPLVRGFHAAVAAMVQAGFHVIVDHVAGDHDQWLKDAVHTFSGFSVAHIGVHCALPELLERERNRADRPGYPDIAERQHGSIHGGCIYDLEVDGTRESTEVNADRVAAWLETASDLNAFERMRAQFYPAKSAKASPGCFQLYTGNGKGKTTAATGLAVRALGAGYRVFIGQFMKHDASSEMRALRGHFPGVTVEFFGTRWMIGKPATPADREAAQHGLARLTEIIKAGRHELVFADEINVALSRGLLELAQVLALVELAAGRVELVCTGRDAPQELIARAGLVTEMTEIKHHFNTGIPARYGIEF